MSENKEILCPVCGEEMEPTVVEEKPLHRYKCVQKNCTLASGLYYCEALDIEKSTLARIDRAVEEAVRAKDVEIAALREALRVAETGVKNRDVILDSIRNSKKACPQCHDRGKIYDDNGGDIVCPCHLE